MATPALSFLRHLALVGTVAVAAALPLGAEPTPEAPAPAKGEKTILDLIPHQKGPCSGDLGEEAQITVPEGFAYADAKNTRKLLEMMQNPTNGAEVGMVVNIASEWLVVFDFNALGYIKDAEKEKLDAAAMLKSMQEGNEAGNKEREKRGWATLTLVGWEQPPHYDAATNNLEWAIKGESDGHAIVNYSTRILGRAGVMSVTLVCAPTALPTVLPAYKDLLKGYTYKDGHRYAEWRSGDKIAKYGLSALVVGGATAVAVKAGLFKYLWKFLIIGGVAVSAGFKKFFGGRSAQ